MDRQHLPVSLHLQHRGSAGEAAAAGRRSTGVSRSAVRGRPGPPHTVHRDDAVARLQDPRRRRPQRVSATDDVSALAPNASPNRIRNAISRFGKGRPRITTSASRRPGGSRRGARRPGAAPRPDSSRDLHEAAQRDGPDPVLRLPDLLSSTNGGKNRPKRSTRMPHALAAMKWPNSCRRSTRRSPRMRGTQARTASCSTSDAAAARASDRA